MVLQKLVLIFLLFSHLSFSKETITFSAGAKLTDRQASFIIPKLKKAFSKMDIEFRAVFIPSERSIVHSNSGITDGELHRIKDFHKVTNGKYPNLIKINHKMMSVWVSAFAVDKKIKINSWEDFKKYKICYYRGRKNIQNRVDKIVPKENIFIVKNDLQAFSMLARKRVDIVISESSQGLEIIKSDSQFSNIREIKKLNETEIYSYINKKYKHLIKQLVHFLKKE